MRLHTSHFEYRKIDVFALGSISVATRRRTSAAANARLKKLKAISVPNAACAEQFLRNGIGGLRLIKQHAALCAQHPGIDNDTWQRVFNGYISVAGAVGICERKRAITVALKQRGLVMRTDSRSCRMFAERNIGNPHDIADEMKLMDFLYRYTIIRRGCQHYYTTLTMPS